MSKIVGVIPARWGSTRFPGKSLAPLHGRPMIEWVVERTRQAQSLSETIVATDDERIAGCIRELNLSDVRAVMTRDDHPSGTDRIAEAIQGQSVDAVINIQGDEPLIDPLLIDQLAEVIADERWDMATAASPIRDPEEITDPSVVKTVFDREGQALYFSRSVIPYIREGEISSSVAPYWRHIGIYAYQSAFLQRLVAEPPSLLEQCEMLEQLRALHLGCRMKVIQTEHFGIGVDTPEDLIRAEELLKTE